MVHADNQGLVVPPRVACIQVIYLIVEYSDVGFNSVSTIDKVTHKMQANSEILYLVNI